jgi:hypothetical protein
VVAKTDPTTLAILKFMEIIMKLSKVLAGLTLVSAATLISGAGVTSSFADDYTTMSNQGGTYMSGSQSKGGQAKGGQAKGGQAKGGQAKGGQAKGGQAKGGQAKGGQAKGGQAKGGQATK